MTNVMKYFFLEGVGVMKILDNLQRVPNPRTAPDANINELNMYKIDAKRYSTARTHLI